MQDRIDYRRYMLSLQVWTRNPTGTYRHVCIDYADSDLFWRILNLKSSRLYQKNWYI